MEHVNSNVSRPTKVRVLDRETTKLRGSITSPAGRTNVCAISLTDAIRFNYHATSTHILLF